MGGLFHRWRHPRRCYVVCAIARSGSNLLTDGLRATRRAGRPKQYFLPAYEATYKEWSGITTNDFATYAREIIPATATSNEVFGFKLMGWYLEPFLDRLRASKAFAPLLPSALSGGIPDSGMSSGLTAASEIDQKIRQSASSRAPDLVERSPAASEPPNPQTISPSPDHIPESGMASDLGSAGNGVRPPGIPASGMTADLAMLRAAFPRLQFVQIVRQNKLRQAVSKARAAQTGLWKIQQRNVAKGEASFDRELIASCIEDTLREERIWADFFARSGVEPLRVVYEELCVDYADTIARVLEFLQIQVPRSMWPKPETIRQTDALSREWEERFLALGLPNEQRSA